MKGKAQDVIAKRSPLHHSAKSLVRFRHILKKAPPYTAGRDSSVSATSIDSIGEGRLVALNKARSFDPPSARRAVDGMHMEFGWSRRASSLSVPVGRARVGELRGVGSRNRDERGTESVAIETRICDRLAAASLRSISGSV
jgi:hypothetical protein